MTVFAQKDGRLLKNTLTNKLELVTLWSLLDRLKLLLHKEVSSLELTKVFYVRLCES